LNLYSYVHNNPLIYTDPSGQLPKVLDRAWDTVTNEVKNNANYVWNGTKSNANYVWNGTKNNVTNAWNAIGEEWDNTLNWWNDPVGNFNENQKKIKLFYESATEEELEEYIFENVFGTGMAGRTKSVSVKVGLKASSGTLRFNMIMSGVKLPAYKNAAHHIVAGGDKRAALAQSVLKKYKIDINAAENGVFLPRVKNTNSSAAYHPSLHTNAYYQKVNKLLSGAGSRDEVIEVLNKIRKGLLDGTF